MGTSTIRSRATTARASSLSPEVEWYLQDRGIGLPTCHPLIKTPEPRRVKGSKFSPERVDRVLASLAALRHTKGKWAGRPLVLAPVQVGYIVAPIFGWVVPDGDGGWRRVIRDAYVEMPRKGAKTTVGGGLSMYLAFGDDEQGAEVVLGAASRDQAGQAFRPLVQLANSSPVLTAAGVKPTRFELTQPGTGSSCKVVSSRGELAHGANIHGALIDELHVHRNPDLLEAVESGTGARRQPLVLIITTADDGQTESVYAQRRETIEKVAAGTIKAPSMYGVVFAARAGEDPLAESTWAAANPLFPVTPSLEFMRSAAEKAQANPAALASFLRLHLGVRARMDKQFFDMGKWADNRGVLNEERLHGQPAFGGLDLSSVSDLTALAWLIPDPVVGGAFNVLWRFWLPESALPALDASTARMASGWVKEGWVTLTPGDVVDYGWVRRTVLEDVARFDVQSVGYDRWNASQLVVGLAEEGVPMVRVGQGVASLSAPMKEVDRLVRSGTARRPMLVHGGNPVARWMADNTRAYMDAAGNVKPDKARSTQKIDGISALVTAMAMALSAEKQTVSAYDDHDLIVI